MEIGVNRKETVKGLEASELTHAPENRMEKDISISQAPGNMLGWAAQAGCRLLAGVGEGFPVVLSEMATAPAPHASLEGAR